MVDIVNYSTEKFEKGDSYRTLNCRSSSISAFHETVEGLKVGQHGLVQRLMTALFNARPPCPKYSETWDVDCVLVYIKSLGSDNLLSDKNLTLKLAMLLALASTGRTSELSALDVRYMMDKGDCIEFKLAKLTKSRRTGQSPLSLVFESFPTNKSLCVVSTLRTYLGRSDVWRKRKDGERNQLLLSYVEPHKPVVSCSIAGWLVKVLTDQ